MLVDQARQSTVRNTGDYAARVASVRDRLETLVARLQATAERQNRYLQVLAIGELQAQKRRIEAYQVQARYALASIYDRALSGKPQASP